MIFWNMSASPLPVTNAGAADGAAVDDAADGIVGVATANTGAADDGGAADVVGSTDAADDNTDAANAADGDATADEAADVDGSLLPSDVDIDAAVERALQLFDIILSGIHYF